MLVVMVVAMTDVATYENGLRVWHLRRALNQKTKGKTIFFIALLF
jgi:hypothetical protein